ncbi:hypothetical protein L9F63_023373, partial [Diploptera punctata]
FLPTAKLFHLKLKKRSTETHCDVTMDNTRNRQFIVSLYALVGVVLAGGVLSWDQNRYSLTIGPVTYCVTAGAVFGSLLSVISTDYLGRKPTLMISSTLFFYSWTMILYSSSHAMLVAARFIAGVATGLLSVVAPIYIGEISFKSRRETLSSLIYILINVGVLLMYLCQNTWAIFQVWAEGIFSALSLLSILLLFFIPESPYFLINKDKSKAKSTLQYLRSPDPSEELNELISEVGKSPTGLPTLDMMNSFDTRKALVITSFLFMTQTSCGVVLIKFLSTNGHVFTGDMKLYRILFGVFLLLQVLIAMMYWKFVTDARRKRIMLATL